MNFSTSPLTYPGNNPVEREFIVDVYLQLAIGIILFLFGHSVMGKMIQESETDLGVMIVAMIVAIAGLVEVFVALSKLGIIPQEMIG